MKKENERKSSKKKENKKEVRKKPTNHGLFWRFEIAKLLWKN